MKFLSIRLSATPKGNIHFFINPLLLKSSFNQIECNSTLCSTPPHRNSNFWKFVNLRNWQESLDLSPENLHPSSCPFSNDLFNTMTNGGGVFSSAMLTSLLLLLYFIGSHLIDGNSVLCKWCFSLGSMLGSWLLSGFFFLFFG